jgi:hypothetical protein
MSSKEMNSDSLLAMYAPPNNVTEQRQRNTDDRDNRSAGAEQDDYEFDGFFHWIPQFQGSGADQRSVPGFEPAVTPTFRRSPAV